MSGPQYFTADDRSPWERYTTRQQTANRVYLNAVISAHNEYLTSPWPDREAYEHAERSAWMTYYAVCRQAWRTFEQEVTPPPPPPAPAHPSFSPADIRHQLNEFDQRQETYLAADLDRRDVR